MILDAEYGTLPVLAERLGVSVNALRVRRQVLRGSRNQRTVKPPPSSLQSVKRSVVSRRFERPAWFEEDLGSMLKLK